MAKKLGPKELELRNLREHQQPEERQDLFDAEAIRQRIRDATAKELEPLDAELERLKAVRDHAEAKIAELERVKAQITGQPSTAKGGNGATRTRRSKDELAADANKILDLIRSKGKDGATGGEIKEAFPNVTGTIRAFLGKNAPSAKFKTEGEKTQMRYFAD